MLNLCKDRVDVKHPSRRLISAPSLFYFTVISSFPNEDSGRVSCYDPDGSNQDTLMLMATLLPGQAEDEEDSLEFEKRASVPDGSKTGVNLQAGGPQTWVNTDFYAQVSNVMPSGGVVLSPGQQLKIQESTPAAEEKTHKKAKDPKDVEEKKPAEQQFQLLVVDPEDGGYTTESSARQINTPPRSPMPGEGYQTIHPQPVETKPAPKAENNPSPYILPESPQAQNFAPVADYTVVQECDRQHSLLLNPPPRNSPPPCMPQRPLKALPAMPVGYITPDLLGDISP